MCDFSNGLKLCSCDSDQIRFREPEKFRIKRGKRVPIKSKVNEETPLIYIWRLFRKITVDKEWLEMGQYLMPSYDIGKSLNADWIALNLNVENCFDFDYTPTEGDNLFIQRNEMMAPYISFIYTKGEWQIDHYDPFEVDVELLKEGIIKEIPPKKINA